MGKTDILFSDTFNKTAVLSSGDSGTGVSGNNGGSNGNSNNRNNIFDWKKCLISLAIIAGIILVLYMIIYLGVLSTPGFPDDSKMTMVHTDNVYRLSWKSAHSKYDEYYIVKIFEGHNVNPKSPVSESKILFEKEYMEADIPLNDEYKLEVFFSGDFLKDKEVTIYVDTTKHFGFMHRDGKHAMTASVNLSEPNTYDVDVNIDTEKSEITFDSGAGNAENYTLYLDKKQVSGDAGSNQVLSNVTSTRLADMFVIGDRMSANLKFDSTDIKMPEDGELYKFNLVGEYSMGPLTYYDLNFNSVVLNRENFLTGKVTVYTTDDGKNRFTFTWNETKGEGYKISFWDNDTESWTVVGQISGEEERSFRTGKLLPCKKYKVRVEAIGTGEDVSEEERVNEFVIQTVPSAEYSTIWPTTNLTIYKESTGEEGIGSAEALRPLTVLDEKDGRFHIRTGFAESAKEGYIDSDYCMINLPEYMGNLCKYDITNAYSSIYNVAGYAIPSLSGDLVTGYESILLEDGTFVVPLLYPAAKKLVAAGNMAREQGYILKVTDAYIPGVASDYIYSSTSAALDYNIPKEKFDRITLKEYRSGSKASGMLDLSALSEATGDNADSSKTKTYKNVMTKNDEYKLDTFIAKGQSTHNLGLAVDVTLVRTKNSKEVKMQSGMHDLCYKSVQKNNNEGSNVLNDIMIQSGFSGTAGKWWLFYDKESRDRLTIDPPSSGVAVKGWKKDDRGWRYRKSGGSYYRDASVKIGKKEYSFDADGYLVE